MANDISNLVEIREFEDESGKETGSELVSLSQEIDLLQERLSINKKMAKDSVRKNDDLNCDFERGQALIDKLRETLLFENSDKVVFDVRFSSFRFFLFSSNLF